MKTRKTITIDGDAYEISDQFLSEVLERAAEGGCSYWADVSVEHADDAGPDGERGLDASDYDEDEDDDEEGNEADGPLYTAASFLVSNDPAQGGTLDLEDIADAIERIASGEVEIPPAVREIIITAVREDDASEIDAEAVDCIVQVGLFDEIVYS
jgi:hypothetical protein